MKQVIKGMVFRSWLLITFLVIVLSMSLFFAFLTEDTSFFAVFCWVCVYALSLPERKQLMLEFSLPVKKETVVDAHFTVMSLVLLFEAVIWLIKADLVGESSFISFSLFMLILSCGIWNTVSLGLGGSAMRVFSLVLFTVLMIATIIGGPSIEENMHMGALGGILTVALGFLSYAVLWLVSRRNIRRAEIA